MHKDFLDLGKKLLIGFPQPGKVMESVFVFFFQACSLGICSKVTKVMEFLNTDFYYQNAWNAYLPTSPFLLFLIWFLDYQVMDLHDLVMENSWKSHGILWCRNPVLNLHLLCDLQLLLTFFPTVLSINCMHLMKEGVIFLPFWLLGPLELGPWAWAHLAQ